MPGAEPVRSAILDASVAMRWIVPEVGTEHAVELLSQAIAWKAPRLMMTEIAAALRRKVAGDDLRAEQAIDALDALLTAVADGTVQLTEDEAIMRTVNLGFYLGADARGAARAEEKFRSHFGSGDRAARTGYLRGTVKDAHAMVDQFRALGCTRLSIAFREGPYDWEALEAFAAEIVRAG